MWRTIGLDDCSEVYVKVAVGETDTAVCPALKYCAPEKNEPESNAPRWWREKPDSNEKLIVTFCNWLHLNPRST
jgi:hypothetical protein